MHQRRDDKIKKLVLIFGAGLLFSSPVIAQVIDPEWKVIDLKRRAERQACLKNNKNMIRKEKCVSAAYDKYERNGDVPGTKEYVKKHYSHMSNVQLSNFLRKYQKDYVNKCRSVHSYDDPLPGEVTCSMVNDTTSELNMMLDLKGGGPNPFDHIFGKGTSFGSENVW